MRSATILAWTKRPCCAWKAGTKRAEAVRHSVPRAAWVASSALARGQLQHPVLGGCRGPRPVATAPAAQRRVGDGDPGPVEQQPGQQDQPAGNRPDGGALPELAGRGDRYGMDQQLADVGDDLDAEDPAI